MASSFDSEIETPETETLASLANGLIYRLPGCGDVMVRKTLQEVYRDFCRRSCCLQERRRFLQEKGCVTITLPVPDGCVVQAVTRVGTCGHTMREGRDYVVASSMRSIQVSMSFVKDAPCEFDVEYALIPLVGSERVPKRIIDLNGDALSDGALARLQSMTGRPWSDPQQAAQANIRYENAVSEERYRRQTNTNCGDAGYAIRTDGLI